MAHASVEPSRPIGLPSIREQLFYDRAWHRSNLPDEMGTSRPIYDFSSNRQQTSSVGLKPHAGQLGTIQHELGKLPTWRPAIV